MGAWEIVLIVACAAFVTAVAVTWLVKKIKGEPTCDCCGDCAHCAGCERANAAKVAHEKTEKNS